MSDSYTNYENWTTTDGERFNYTNPHTQIRSSLSQAEYKKLMGIGSGRGRRKSRRNIRRRGYSKKHKRVHHTRRKHTRRHRHRR